MDGSLNIGGKEEVRSRLDCGFKRFSLGGWNNYVLGFWKGGFERVNIWLLGVL